MSKKILLFAVALVLVFFAVGCGKKEAKLEAGGSVEEFQSTIEDMAKSGKPYKCEYKMTVENITQEGILYFGGKDMMRGDIALDMPEMGKSHTHFIKSGDTQYIWTDEQPGGIKMTITEEELKEMQEMGEGEFQQNIDMNTKMNLKCVKWSPDASMFKPPSNIEFQDLSAMMENLGASMGGAGNSGGSGLSADDIDMCYICMQIPAGSARNDCLRENDCN
jgi:hypothetical protein